MRAVSANHITKRKIEKGSKPGAGMRPVLDKKPTGLDSVGFNPYQTENQTQAFP